MNILKPLWTINFIFGLANLLLFVSDGEGHNLIAAVVCATVCGLLYEATWRKK